MVIFIVSYFVIGFILATIDYKYTPFKEMLAKGDSNLDFICVIIFWPEFFPLFFFHGMKFLIIKYLRFIDKL